jgi:uncharacterized RDD family membrane protein YckC
MSNPYAPPQATVADVVDPRLGHVAAERGTRLAAAILDGIIGGAMIYSPFFIGAVIGGIAGGTNPAPFRMTGAMAAGLGVSAIGFIIWCWMTIVFVRRNGQSIAKKALNIKVVRTDGSPITLARIFFLRNLVNAALSIIPLYGFIDLLFIFGEQRQCLHDKIADTIVVKA